MKLRKYWRDLSDISIHEAALIMLGINPDEYEDSIQKEASTNLMKNDQFYDQYQEILRIIFSATDAKAINVTTQLSQADGFSPAETTRINKQEWLNLLIRNGGYESAISAFEAKPKSSIQEPDHTGDSTKPNEPIGIIHSAVETPAKVTTTSELLNDDEALLTTAEAALILNRSSNTLRKWACYQNGPIQPVRINGRLSWKAGDLRALTVMGPCTKRKS